MQCCGLYTCTLVVRPARFHSQPSKYYMKTAIKVVALFLGDRVAKKVISKVRDEDQ